MPIGGLIIGLGLIYHLSIFNFIAYIGWVPARIVFTTALMAIFVAVPVVFGRYRHAIAIDFGIMAAMVLSSNSTYFLAIPLILTAVVFFKKDGIISAVYYGIITSPLMIVIYFQHIITIPRSEWWNPPSSSPPLFLSLSPLYHQLQQSMPDFSLYKASNLVYQVTSSSQLSLT